MSPKGQPDVWTDWVQAKEKSAGLAELRPKIRIRNFTNGKHVCQLLYRNARYVSPVTKVLKVNLKLILLAFHITV